MQGWFVNRNYLDAVPPHIYEQWLKTYKGDVHLNNMLTDHLSPRWSVKERRAKRVCEESKSLSPAGFLVVHLSQRRQACAAFYSPCTCHATAYGELTCVAFLLLVGCYDVRLVRCPALYRTGEVFDLVHVADDDECFFDQVIQEVQIGTAQR